MRDRLDEFGEDCEVVLVMFGTHDDLIGYLRDNALTFSIVRDPDRSGYQAFGLGRGSVARVWGLRAAKRYVDLFRSNGLRGLRRPTQDTRQLGGDFVIDPRGRLSWGFWSEGPDDRPSVDDLVHAVAEARGN